MPRRRPRRRQGWHPEAISYYYIPEAAWRETVAMIERADGEATSDAAFRRELKRIADAVRESREES